ncbi:MAG: glycoside hydrolase family 3 N-terminal domain-containing protein [Bacteroidales bacterium]
MKAKLLFSIGTLSTMLMGCSHQPEKDAKIEERIDALMKQMTLEEKIGQMCQLNSNGNVADYKELIKAGKIGSFLNEINPATINEMQRIAMEESRLKIPILFARDVIHGFKTIFPIPLGQAASWNPLIVEEGGRVAAIEATEVGIRWTFAPMLDVTRDPRWGRIAESLGEDPYLASVLGAAMVKGFQGNDLSETTSMAACMKHYAGYGFVEGGRDYNTTMIPEVVLREVVLPPFKAAVDAGVATAMSSFNEINGVPSTGNSFLLKKVLRDEWNFKGFVVSDWAAVAEMIVHGYCADEKEAAMKAVNAGLDMEMVTPLYAKHLDSLVKEGKVSVKTIDEAVRNILRVKFKLGLFDNPYVKVPQTSKIYADSHLAAAKEAAIQSVVLLKNENNVLPLGEKVKSIAIIGPLADAPSDQLGTWVLDGDKNYTQTPLKAIKAEYGNKLNIIYEPTLGYSRDINTSNFGKAIAAARRADVVLMFLGEESILSGEARCRADINLPGVQSQLVEEIKKTGKPMVLVIMAGRPLTIEKEVNLSDAVLYAWHPGTMGGPAIADLLFGKAVPSGKLPVTFPKVVGQIPIYYNHKNTGRPPQDNLQLIGSIPPGAKQLTMGYVSYYLDAGAEPLFPFGYGLSYTTFEYSNLQLSKTELKKQDEITVTCQLKNTGKYEADEVVQLYIRDRVGSLTRPVKELKGFQRIHLKPQESKTVSFTLKTDDLAFWNAEMKKVTEPGDFDVWIGPNSKDGLKSSFMVLE